MVPSVAGTIEPWIGADVAVPHPAQPVAGRALITAVPQPVAQPTQPDETGVEYETGATVLQDEQARRALIRETRVCRGAQVEHVETLGVAQVEQVLTGVAHAAVAHAAVAHAGAHAVARRAKTRRGAQVLQLLATGVEQVVTGVAQVLHPADTTGAETIGAAMTGAETIGAAMTGAAVAHPPQSDAIGAA